MDARLLKQVQVARNVSRQDIADGLVETIIQIGGDPLTVRKAKDELSAVLGKARNGVPQVIGNIKKADDMAVVISVKDLAELVAAARQQETFGEASTPSASSRIPVAASSSVRAASASVCCAAATVSPPGPFRSSR